MRRRLQEAQDANRERGKKTKDKILSLIAKSEPLGMSTADLQKETGLHRDRIHVVCKEYLDTGVLTKTGHFGKYHLGPKSREDVQLKAFFFQQKVFEDFPLLAGKGASTSSKYFNYQNYGRLLHHSKDREEYNKSFSKRNIELDELYLYEYSLKLGAILTYQLIQSIRFAQQKPDLDLAKKDQIILKWTENFINPLSVLDTFSRLYPVYKRMQRPKDDTTDFRPSFFELYTVKVEELERIFENVFPELFKDLEKIKLSDEVAGKIEGAKNHALEMIKLENLETEKKRLEKKDPKHVKCGGEPDPKWVMNRNGKLMTRCSKCSRWIPVRVESI